MRLSQAFQPSLILHGPVVAATHELAQNAGTEARGAIFTRREVVDFILDLVGYTTEQPLSRFRLLEPSFGDGDFLIPAIHRLIEAYLHQGGDLDCVDALYPAITAIEIHRATFDATRQQVVAALTAHGIALEPARALADAWLHQGDFLLAEAGDPFTHIVGNPPYIRQEMIPSVLMTEYRRRYATIYDRADIYVPFIERSLQLLGPGGALGFICADRWMKNRYGGPLRQLVADHYHLRSYVDMMDTDAFHVEVSAYPAIFVIAKEQGNVTRLAHRPVIDSVALRELAGALTGTTSTAHTQVTEISALARGAAPWLLESFDQLAVVRRLEAAFPTMEEAGCKVGIGVATGADKVFVGPFDALDVEDDRKLPLAMSRDILSGSVVWRGNGVINPFKESGELVALANYPRLARYLEAHGAQIRDRHVSKKNPNDWYRTIDRIHPALTYKPKLLIPDIKNEANIVYEPGQLYPHHNLYFITSDEWDIRALQAVLLSGIAKLFVGTYSTKMRGGYLRFQAQYLRRIRVPHWQQVPDALRHELRAAGVALDLARCNEAVCQLYRLSAAERQAIARKEVG
jgi:hypothetical protein